MPVAIEVADAKRDHWLIKSLPLWLVPYAQIARWERPIGWWLLLLPCWWGLLLAQVNADEIWPSLWFAVLFFIGAVAMRGAGCTLNDIVDRNIDGSVARTKQRPLPSGRITVKKAFVFMGVQALVGLIVVLQFNTYTIVLAFASLGIVAVYPFMKRITYWPQFVLGLAFNWGALLGWTAVNGKLSASAILLYVSGILWTLAYDTIYAHQDKDDDVMIGVKSTALRFGDQTSRWLVLFFATSLLAMSVAFWLASAGIIAYVGIIAAALHAAWQVMKFEADNSDVCLKLFKSNKAFGLLITAFLLLDLIIT